MSWWVSLRDDKGDVVLVEPFEEGGTRVLGGSIDADLNITYNYSGHFYNHGLRFHGRAGNVHGKKAADVIPLLEKAVAALGTETDPDYWEATPGNAGHALAILLNWARQYPQAHFEVH